MSWHEENKEFNGLINQLFLAENAQDRAEAARKLGFLKDGRATNLMCRALKIEKDKFICNKIIEALGRIADPKATMIICQYLSNQLKEYDVDKFTIIYIIESLTRLKDKRALVYIGPFLTSEDRDIKKIAQEAFDTIEPNWREIMKNNIEKDKAIQQIFKIKF